MHLSILFLNFVNIEFEILVVAMFLGTNIEKMNLESRGWGILVGWSVWVLICVVLIEILYFFLQKRPGYFLSYFFVYFQKL